MNAKQAKRLRRDAREIVPVEHHKTSYDHQGYRKSIFGLAVGVGTRTVNRTCLRGVYRAFKKSLRAGQTV
jgi:hypothetical protein